MESNFKNLQEMEILKEGDPLTSTFDRFLVSRAITGHSSCGCYCGRVQIQRGE